MVESSNASCDGWSADSVMAIIENAQKARSYNRVTRWLAVDLKELRQRLEAWDTKEDRRKTMLKLYPGLFFLVAMSLGEDISE